MAMLKILTFPDPRLRRHAQPVAEVDAVVHQLVQDMLATMYQANGIGLAATQVDVHQQVIVMDLSAERNQPRVFINPEIKIIDPALFEYKEGCLSVPDYFDKVQRPRKVEIRYLDLHNQLVETEAEGLLSVCIQHEMDHLNGKLFIDYLSQLKKNRIRKQQLKRVQSPQ